MSFCHMSHLFETKSHGIPLYNVVFAFFSPYIVLDVKEAKQIGIKGAYTLARGRLS